MKRLPGLMLAPLLALPLAACGTGDEDRTTVTVLAAASLTESFTRLAEAFEREHDGVEVTLALDSSATLAEQALGGAPADVLATADLGTMTAATEALAAEPQTFATNTMVLVTPADNPARVTAFADLAAGDVTYVVCVESAPCGKVTDDLLDDAGLKAEPASLEVDVKAVLARVVSGEADAGLVYATDAVAAGDEVRTFDVPGAGSRSTTYPIAPLTQAAEPALARQFVELVLSPAGREVLAAAGFGTP